MPRKSLPQSKENFYYLTARSFDQDTFYIPKDSVQNLLNSKLNELMKEFEIKVAAVVVEQNKFHLLIQSPNEPIHRIMYFLMRRLTRAIQKRSKRINHVFGGRYKGCLILQDSQLKHIHDYLQGLAEEGKSPFTEAETMGIVCGLKKTVFEYQKVKGTRKYLRPT